MSSRDGEKRKVSVFARLRPARGEAIEHAASAEQLRVRVPTHGGARDAQLRFAFDGVFDEACGQDAVYARVAAPLVDDLLRGVNSTVFAYGQTGAGKTYSVIGGETFAERGLIPRALAHVFRETARRAAAAPRGARWSVEVSFAEVYQERVYDLLDAANRSKPLEEWAEVQLLEDGYGDVHPRNLSVFEAKTEEEALSLFFVGNLARITAQTPLNDASSRSHCVFSITVVSHEPPPPPPAAPPPPPPPGAAPPPSTSSAEASISARAEHVAACVLDGSTMSPTTIGITTLSTLAARSSLYGSASSS